MGCRFGLNGKMVLRESEEAASDLEDLKELIGEIEMTCQAKDGLVEVSLSGEYSMSYGTAVEIEKTLKDFSVHVTEATYFDTDCDGEEGIIWVGKPENIKQAQRAKLIYETVVLLQQLTPDEINMALKMASDTKPAAPPEDDEAVLLKAIKEGFDDRKAGMFVSVGGRHSVETQAHICDLFIESTDEFDKTEYGPTTLADMFLGGIDDVPVIAKDHAEALDIVIYGLRRNEQLAKEITGLTTDGDNHDCEAMFLFRNQAWTIKVR